MSPSIDGFAPPRPPEILAGRRRRRAPDAVPSEPPAPAIDAAIEDLEKPMVLQALALAEWDRERAAELLHIDAAALEELMRRHKIEP